MKEIRYALLDPTGNTTILAETPVPPEEQPFVAKQIMARETGAEQAGFVSPYPGGNGIALRMAGGEFCGDAAMSAAVLYALDRGIADGTVRVGVSGTPDPVEVAVSSLAEGTMRGTVAMPRPLSVGEELLPGGGRYPVVRFAGITHVIVIVETPLLPLSPLSPTVPLHPQPSPRLPFPRETAEELAKRWCAALGSASLGLLLLGLPNLSDQPGRREGSLVPLVYVPAADTLCWENSCASGTTAVGAYLAAREGPVSLSLRQPGGTLRVEASSDGGLYLTGTVRLCRRSMIPVREANG